MPKYPFIIFLSLFCGSALGLDVAYPFPPLRFSLSVGKDHLFYQSEGARRELISAPCNRPVIEKFVGELFQKIPKKKSDGKLHVKIDKSKFNFERGSDLHRYLENMDGRMIRVLLDAKKACK